MTEAERNSIALFRYGILAPFIQRQVAIANKLQFASFDGRKCVLERPFCRA